MALTITDEETRLVDADRADELVKDGENGFLVKFKDSQDIADKIEKIILDEELRKKMALASRALAEKMSWESVAQKYFEVYKKVAKKY